MAMPAIASNDLPATVTKEIPAATARQQEIMAWPYRNKGYGQKQSYYFRKKRFEERSESNEKRSE